MKHTTGVFLLEISGTTAESVLQCVLSKLGVPSMMIISIKSLFAKPISSVEQGAEFLNALINAGMIYHLEDDPAAIVSTETGELLFTPEEAVLIKQRVKELYALNWSAYGEACPMGYCLQVMQALDEAASIS